MILSTDDRGRAAGQPLGETVTANLDLAVAQGRIRREDRAHWRKLMEHPASYDSAVEALAAIPPQRAFASAAVDDAAYVGFARQTGILPGGQPPEALFTVRHW